MIGQLLAADLNKRSERRETWKFGDKITFGFRSDDCANAQYVACLQNGVFLSIRIFGVKNIRMFKVVLI